MTDHLIIKRAELFGAKAHAILGPSSADRWWNCPGSPQMIQRVKTPASTYAAAEGTVAHYIASTYLDALADESPRAFEYMVENYVGKTFLEDGHEIKVEADWVDPLNVYINYCLEGSEGLDPRYVKTEYRVPLIGGADYDGLEREGTADRVHIHPFKKLHGMDLKWGKGKLVKAFKNLQGLDYILGTWRSLSPGLIEDITWLDFTIIQPRHFLAGDGIDTWSFHVSDLIKFEAEVPERVAATKDPNAKVVAGDWCDNSFCPARLECPAYQAYVEGACTAKLADLATKIDLPMLADKSKIVGNVTPNSVEGFPHPRSLTPEQRALVLDRAAAVRSWINLVEQAVEQDCKENDAVHAQYQKLGYQLEEGLGNRKWGAEEAEIVPALQEHLGEANIYEKKLKSPTAIEKLLGKTSAANKQIQEQFVVRESTGVKLKPAKDPSKAVNPADKFKGITIDVPAKVK